MTYTREQILSMTNQELAEATAVHVMGWEWQQPQKVGAELTQGYWWSLSLKEPIFDWNPAEDIKDAMEVVEVVHRKSLHFSLQKDAIMSWVANFYAGSHYHYARSNSDTDAICKAALLYWRLMGL